MLQQSLHLQVETDSWGSLFQKQSVPQSPLPSRRLNCREEFLNACSPGPWYMQHSDKSENHVKICHVSEIHFFFSNYSSIKCQIPAFQSRGSKALLILNILVFNIGRVVYNPQSLSSNGLHIIPKVITSLATGMQKHMENFSSSCWGNTATCYKTGF